MKGIEARLAAVERHVQPLLLRIVTITGGLSGDEPVLAKAGGHCWERAPDETLADFTARTVAEAEKRGERFSVS